MRIVLDSTMDVSDELREKVTFVPLKVEIAGEVFEDGRDLSEVFKLMRKKNAFAKTSQPSPGEFERIYSELLEETDWVLSIHISEKLSGTISSARMAAERFRGRVFVFDSGFATIAAQLYVERALEIEEEPPEVVLKEMEKIKSEMELYLTVGNLEFLKRSGRLKGIEALIGSILRLRPLIEVSGGALKTKKVYRSNAKVLKTMKDLMEGAEEAVIGHILAPQVAEDLFQHAEKLGIKARIVPVRSCALSVHLGPESYGIALRRRR